MAAGPRLFKVIKGGYVLLDSVNGAVLRILPFQYNPETVTRHLNTVLVPPNLPPTMPQEFMSFTVSFDAADKLETGDPLTQQDGILPMLAALEGLLNPDSNSLVVWVSGNKRIVPVQITEMQFVEQAFDANLNPIRANVAITQFALSAQQLASNPRGLALLNAYLLTLKQLGDANPGGSLAAMGLSGI
jgi:hypothetical protein